MCLILVAWRRPPAFPLVVAANRDELHARPASAAAFWDDHPEILAGRDLQARGTWLGASRSGRFASVTNYRGGHDPQAAESRGALVSRFLLGTAPAKEYIEGISADSYSGFNLLASDGEELWWLSNRDGGARSLAPGFYALGNLLLDTPEVAEVKARFEATPVAFEPMFSLLSGARIVAPAYGTRCSTVLMLVQDACFRVDLPVGREALLPVELGRLQLRRDDHFLVAALARLADQRLQDLGADAAPAPLLHHGHPADVAVGQQPAGADRLVVHIVGDGVHALRIHVVELDPGRHVLLADEDREAEGPGGRLRLLPGHEFNPGHDPKV
jgi:uncharacterized protein with NRDE domain